MAQASVPLARDLWSAQLSYKKSKPTPRLWMSYTTDYAVQQQIYPLTDKCNANLPTIYDNLK